MTYRELPTDERIKQLEHALEHAKEQRDQYFHEKSANYSKLCKARKWFEILFGWYSLSTLFASIYCVTGIVRWYGESVLGVLSYALLFLFLCISYTAVFIHQVQVLDKTS